MPGTFSKPRRAVWMLFAMLIAAAASCRNNISSSELPGTWTMNRNSQHLFPVEFDVSSTTLVLKADENFTATHLSQEVVVFVPTASDIATPINGSGRWKLLQPRSLGGGTQLMLEFKAIQGPGTYKLPFSTMIFSVDKTAGAVKLFYFHDDPDLGRRIDFEKQK
jgi:hypothetical protein